MGVKLLLAYDYPQEVQLLFAEYMDMLIKGDAAFKKYLEIQNYDEELTHLTKKYGLPDGRLYLAYYAGKLAGCIGLKKIDKDVCEMKRLYVRPDFRGRRIGNKLAEQIITDAKNIGYIYMVLDTLPYLKSAIYMYKKLGFYEIARYNNNPMDTSIYMKLDLWDKGDRYVVPQIND